jgi:AcrR family transcriptional regulator
VPAERRTNEERTRTTRRALVLAARERFEADGYAAVSIDAIAEAAGVTKGALYHHFPTKLAVYDAVVVDIQDELSAHVDRSAKKAETAWDKFVDAWIAFIEVAPEPGIRRLMLEAPAILGYARWQEIDDEHNLPPIVEALEHLHRRSGLAFEPSADLARILLALSNALGTLVSQDEDPARLRAVVIPVWEHLLRSLAAPPD